MTKTTEKKFTCNVNYQFDITLEDLRDLFCTMGQGSYYWCNDMEVGYFERDLDAQFVQQTEGLTYVRFIVEEDEEDDD